jgi:HEAT repeat protein
MKRFLLLLLTLAFPVVAHCAEEDDLITVLQSSQSPQEKDTACVRLKLIGTAKLVPVLANLLNDADLSVSARYALESMPAPEAEKALLAWLPKTTGSNEIGIIDSLGVRADAAAVWDLAPLLSNDDTNVAIATSVAMGHIGGPECLRALQTAWTKSSPRPVHVAHCDALLACANQLLTHHDERGALAVFQQLFDQEKEGGVRLAAFRGIILSSGKHGADLMVKAISGDDEAMQGAALGLAPRVDGSSTTTALAELLTELKPAVQIALLQALGWRGDRLAVPAVLKFVTSTDASIRLAAITALGELRDGGAAIVLAQTAATMSGATRGAARQALLDLNHGPVTDTLLKALPHAEPAVQLEIIRALGDRGDNAAVPKLLALARDNDDALRAASFQALALLAGQKEIPPMIQMVVKATNDDVRSEAADALGSTCQHIFAQSGKIDAGELVSFAKIGPIEARVALLGVCSGVSDAQVRELLRAAVNDSDERVRSAALRALCQSQDPQLLPDILNVAKETKAENFRTLAIRGAVQLLDQTQGTPMPDQQKVDTLKSLLAVSTTADDKRQVLSGLGTVPDVRSLDMASHLLDDSEVRVEAADATVKIAGALSKKHPVKAAAALKKVLAQSGNPDVNKSAEAALKKIKQTN